jgi:hypothetical protein
MACLEIAAAPALATSREKTVKTSVKMGKMASLAKMVELHLAMLGCAAASAFWILLATIVKSLGFAPMGAVYGLLSMMCVQGFAMHKIAKLAKRIQQLSVKSAMLLITYKDRLLVFLVLPIVKFVLVQLFAQLVIRENSSITESAIQNSVEKTNRT